jgi:pimeloyl-ACP methyl ester carboxylesterase
VDTFDRRHFLRKAAIAIAATPIGLANFAHAQSLDTATPDGSQPFGPDSQDDTEILMDSSSTSLPTPEGPGSVSQAPNLPDGFTDTFTSRYIDTGQLRLHAVIGGEGPPLLLVHGWPETWYAWRMVMPALAQDFQVVAVDQRGIGLSDKPQDGYDTGTLAADLVALMDALGHQRFAMVGHDTGMWIGYALAADHPDRLDRLAVAETPIPGLSPSPPLLSNAHLNDRLWHFAFNWLAELNEQLVKGREDIYFGWQFASKAAKPLPDYAVRHYVDTLASDPEALHASFAIYRALDTTIAQNQQRKSQRLTLPVLAIGGAQSLGQAVADTMKLGADNVQSLVIAGSGHHPAEETADEMLAALTAFLAPYRDGAAQALEPAAPPLG